jgi:hypothetical protein
VGRGAFARHRGERRSDSLYPPLNGFTSGL